ncbi:MAG: prepilin-type N-terminal cleavage/methylation domain-containing protein, partial [Proteobacteria bacterium]|nr:prepilin-type N-terminal cleavage/methylation domain-containing protein [Pseudomonadota bacterium]
MPTSAPGNRRRRGFERPRRRAGAVHLARGFTLVELLVVVALVAIGAGAVSLALRDRAGSRLDEEAARLVALLEGARAEARAAGLTVRWVP